MLPRWKEAFHSAKGTASQAARTPDGAAGVELVWLRARKGVPMASQIADMPAHLQALPLVLLSDEPSDEEALAAFAAGARGYCNSHAAPSVLKQVSDVVLSGGLWIGESLMRRLVGALSQIRASDQQNAAMGSLAGSPMRMVTHAE